MDGLLAQLRLLADWLNTCERVPLTFAEPGFRQDLETVPQPFIELYLVTDGVLRLTVVDRQETLARGDMATANAHFGNVGKEVSGRFRYGCLSLEVPDEPRFAAWTKAPFLVTGQAGDFSRVETLYKEVAHLYHGPARPFRDHLLKAAFLQLLAAAADVQGKTGADAKPGPGQNPHVRKTLEIMAERRADPGLGLAQIARKVGISPSHLVRVFQAHVGRSPMRYLAELRIRNAQSLLLRSTLSIKEISFMVGFRDQLYFSRVFRQETGMSPRAYRRSGA